MHLLKLVLSALLLLMTTVACSKLASKAPTDQLSQSLFSPGDTSLVPTTDKLSDDCATNANFDTCIFAKNPVAQQNANVNADQAELFRHYGVKLRGLFQTGRLENSHIQILTINTPAFSVFNKGGYKAASSASQSNAEQLSAYYWAERTFEYIGGRLGSTRMPQSVVKIYADDAFTGFASSTNSIHLDRKSGVWAKAFSGEVVVHLLGEATANELTNHTLFPGAVTQHKTCGLDPHACCATNAGCSQALASAFGDYMSAMMFPNKPRLGETVASSPLGQTVCGQMRDLTFLVNKTKDEVYNACPGANGQAALMGAWYASFWWKLRQMEDSKEPGTAADIDVMFFDHAKQWNSSATFAEAKAAALAEAGMYHSGKYLADMQTIFSGL